jgi:hypothetical protein
MRRMTVWTRALTLALALFQAGAPLLAGLADASGGSRNAPKSHIEDRTQRDCAPVHLDDCAFCRVQSFSAPPADPKGVFWKSESGSPEVFARAVAAPASAACRLHQSRAPPTEQT